MSTAAPCGVLSVYSFIGPLGVLNLINIPSHFHFPASKVANYMDITTVVYTTHRQCTMHCYLLTGFKSGYITVFVVITVLHQFAYTVLNIVVPCDKQRVVNIFQIH